MEELKQKIIEKMQWLIDHSQENLECTEIKEAQALLDEFKE